MLGATGLRKLQVGQTLFYRRQWHISRALVRFCVYLLMGYPLVDYGLRHLPLLHSLGTVWDKVILIILAGMALIRLLSGQRPAWFRWQKFAGWYMLYGLGLVFVGFTHFSTAVNGYRADVYFMLFTFVLPFLINADDFLKFIHVASMIATLIGIDGVFQYLMATPIPAAWVDLGEHVRTRVFSVIGSPNELGAYMALMVPILVGLFFYEQNRFRKWLYGIGAFVCFATHLFTFDRGSLLALIAAVVIVAVLFERRLLLLIVPALVIAFFIPSIHHRFMNLFSHTYAIEALKGGRMARWSTAFALLSTNPLFGVGLGHYGGQVASRLHFSVYSDNYYMKVLGESGLIGLLLYLTMQLTLLKEVIQKTVCGALGLGRERYVALGGLVGLLAVLIHNCVENVFEFGPMAAMYFTLATLFLIWGRDSGTQQE